MPPRRPDANEQLLAVLAGADLRRWLSDRADGLPITLSRTTGIYDARSAQVERAWLPAIGPSALCAWRRLVELLDAGESLVRLDRLAADLGLSRATAPSSQIVSTLARLARPRFGIVAVTDGAVLSVRRTVTTPPTSHRPPLAVTHG